MSGADLGYGTRYAIETAPGSGIYVELAEVFDTTPPNVEVSEYEVTHYQSPGRAREFKPQLTDFGSCTVQMNYEANSLTDQRIEELRLAGTVLRHRITYPNGTTVTFSAFVMGYTKGLPLDDRQTAEAEMRVTGVPVVAAAAVPVNNVLPAVSGVAQVGQVLTAFEGLWSTGAAYTYQWQVNGGSWANVAGATARTYTPIVGQVGNPLRVIVTATNTAGAASATSAATANVIAA